MRESEPELLGLVHRLRSGREPDWTFNALTAREASTLFGMIRRSELVHDRRQPSQPAWQGPERRRFRTSQEVVQP